MVRLARLDEALDNAADGHTTTVLIGGDAGVGNRPLDRERPAGRLTMPARRRVREPYLRDSLRTRLVDRNGDGYRVRSSPGQPSRALRRMALIAHQARRRSSESDAAL
jgi:hypothetical protein